MATRLTPFFANIEANLSTNAVLYLFFCFYALVMVLMFLWGFHGEIVYQPNIDLGPVMRYIIGMARGAGYTLNINTAFVLLLAARFIFTSLRDTPLENVLPLDKAFPMIHIVVGYTTALGVLIHGSFHFGWLFGWDLWAWGWFKFNMSVITGAILTVIFILMIIFSRPTMRKNHFRWFYRVHIIGALLFYPLLIIHGMYRTRPETYKYIIPAIVIYIADRLLRRAHASTTTLQLSAADSFFKDDNVLELRVPKPFRYCAGQYAELQVPSINREWHPFTIASAPHEPTLALYIKKLGDWTGILHDQFARRIQGTDDSLLTVRVRGPYGAPCQHVRGYDRVVLISGGIGATPFSAICKELHHLHQSGADRKDDGETVSRWRAGVDTTVVERRLYEAISRLYNVNVDAAVNELTAVDEQRSAFVTDMLQLNALSRNPNENVGTTSDSVATDSEDPDGTGASSTNMLRSYFEETDTEKPNDTLTAKKPISKDDSIFVSSTKALPNARQKIIHLFETRSHLLAFLHSTRVQFFLLLVLMGRIGVICTASIWESSFVSVSSDAGASRGAWVVIADTFLSAIFTLVIPVTIALEMSFMGANFFSRTARVLDFFLLLPAAIASTALNIHAWVNNEPLSNGLIALHYVVFIPLMFVLLLTRLHGTLGGRRLTDSQGRCHCEIHMRIPDVDFVWTTPTANDDLWLRKELEPLASGTDLRLHRYITREKQLDEETSIGGDFITETKLGRPEWDAVFSEVVARANSASTVGIFFCGPHKMGDDIRKSIRKTEIVSALKGAYLRSCREKTVIKDVGVSRNVVKRLKERGCSVRFAFREENFG